MPNIYPKEKGFKMELTIKDEAGAVVDVTGATITFFMQGPGAEFTRVATIDNATGGVCSYTTPDEAQFVDPGVYKIYPKVQLSNGNIFYGDAKEFEVKAYYK